MPGIFCAYKASKINVVCPMVGELCGRYIIRVKLDGFALPPDGDDINLKPQEKPEILSVSNWCSEANIPSGSSTTIRQNQHLQYFGSSAQHNHDILHLLMDPSGIEVRRTNRLMSVICSAILLFSITHTYLLRQCKRPAPEQDQLYIDTQDWIQSSPHPCVYMCSGNKSGHKRWHEICQADNHGQ